MTSCNANFEILNEQIEKMLNYLVRDAGHFLKIFKLKSTFITRECKKTKLLEIMKCLFVN